jgi:hypothetical protein
MSSYSNEMAVVKENFYWERVTRTLQRASPPYGINECGAFLVDTARKEKRQEGNSLRRSEAGLSAVERRGGVDFDI